jgi:hypothetical protein
LFRFYYLYNFSKFTSFKLELQLVFFEVLFCSIEAKA